MNGFESKLSKPVVNLSRHNLFKFYDLLSLGLNFVPLKRSFDKKLLTDAADKLHHTLKLKEFFSKKHSVPPLPPPPFSPPSCPETVADINTRQKPRRFVGKSSWVPPGRFSQARKVIAKLKSFVWQKTKRQFARNNFSTKQKKLLAELRARTDIVIKKADKGNNVVIMNKEDYLTEAMRQLSDRKFYRPLAKPIFEENILEIRNLLAALHKKKFITKKQLVFLTPKKDCRRRFFLSSSKNP